MYWKKELCNSYVLRECSLRYLNINEKLKKKNYSIGLLDNILYYSFTKQKIENSVEKNFIFVIPGRTIL